MDFDRLLRALDQTLRNLMRSRDFLTLCLLEWDRSGRFRVARAGHPAPLLLQADRPEKPVEIAINGRGLGLRPEMPGVWQIHEGHLEPGDWFVMFSDGLTEAASLEGEMFGVERLTSLLRDHQRGGSVQSACTSIFHETALHETQDRDDRTLFILKRKKV
jgi:serine phosphatase RsbU (regulator of sigma subunit)